MKITKIETVKTRPIPYPAPYKPAWIEPGGEPQPSYTAQFLKVHTDEGIVGYGPVSREVSEASRNFLIGSDPFKIESFWDIAMRGGEPAAHRGANGGLDVALWDIIGKAASLPVYKLLGARTDKIKVYAATSRLLPAEELVEEISHIASVGFKAVKIRFHRPDWRDDIKVAEAVRKAFPDMTILVDCNQNNVSPGYSYWSWDTALTVGRAMRDLGVYILEEPLPLRDLDGLKMMSDTFDTPLISGGEHATCIYDYKEHLSKGTFDVYQPDLIIGDMGISGIRKFGHIAEYYGKMIVPHVSLGGNFAMSFPAAAAAVAGLSNCPILEFNYDPPFLTEESQFFFVKEKPRVDADGCIRLSQKPGIGVEIDEEALSKYL